MGGLATKYGKAKAAKKVWQDGKMVEVVELIWEEMRRCVWHRQRLGRKPQTVSQAGTRPQTDFVSGKHKTANIKKTVKSSKKTASNRLRLWQTQNSKH